MLARNVNMTNIPNFLFPCKLCYTLHIYMYMCVYMSKRLHEYYFKAT